MGKRMKCRPILEHVPAEILEEILYKLPIKSLSRFKSVSKSWRSSISSKGFIKEHLNRKNSSGTTDFALIFTYNEISRDRAIGTLSIGSLLSDDDDQPPNNNQSNLSIPTPIPIPVPAFRDTHALDFLCSCNGLILVTINHTQLYLWNPSTRKAKYILNPRETASWHRSGYGLGYDESTDDYKVVCIFSEWDVQMKKQTYMYSSKTGSWKIIQNLYKGLLSHHPAKFVNGRLHWLNDDRDRPRTSTRYIVSLDLVEEKSRILPLPHCMSDDYYYHDTCLLKDLGGYLSFVGNSCTTRRTTDVWVMQKDSSWSKIWTHTYPLFSCPIMPLLLKTNEDILVAFGLDLDIYHGKDKLRHQSRLYMLEEKFDPIVYVETLVSPFADTPNEQLHRH